MAVVVITIKIMPESPETDLQSLAEEAKARILRYAGKTEYKVEEEPVAFGLKAVKITFTADESKGSTEELEKSINDIESVNSCEVVDVRRAIG